MINWEKNHFYRDNFKLIYWYNILFLSSNDNDVDLDGDDDDEHSMMSCIKEVYIGTDDDGIDDDETITELSLTVLPLINDLDISAEDGNYRPVGRIMYNLDVLGEYIP